MRVKDLIEKEENKSIKTKEVRIYLRLAQIRKFNQVILGTSICLFISLVIITAISFHTLIFWPDILLSILFWVFLGSLFAYSLTGSPIDLVKPGITFFGNIFFAIMIFFMALVPYGSFLHALPVAYGLYMFLFVSLGVGGIITFATNTYVLNFWRKYRKKNSKLFEGYGEKVKIIINIAFSWAGILFVGIFILIQYLPDLVYTYFPIAYDLSIIFFIILCILGITALSTTIYNRFIRHKTKNKISKLNRNGKIKKIFVIMLALTGIPLLIMSIPGIIRVPITIEPQDYQVEFVFFAGYGNVSASMGQNLNEHNCTLVFCCFSDIYDINGKQEFVNTFTHYNNTYPNISIFLAFGANPGGFIWDGNAEDAIKNAKEFISIVKEYNLTNIKGLTIDIEPPIPSPAFDVSPNRERHSEAKEMWEDFFDWMRANATDIILSAVYFSEVGIDIFDEDYDYHYINRVLALDMDNDSWDEHAPMIYRDRPYDKPPYGDFFDGGQYYTYTRLNLMTKVLEKKYGSHNKLGIWLDYKNGGCYDDRTCGYNNLVRDALIAKHFGIPKISIFMLNTVGAPTEWGCVFEYYGSDFLDRFNESVNGQDSTNSFQISYEPHLGFMFTFGSMDPFYYDIFMNMNSFLGILHVSLLLVGNSLVAYYGWKKFKAKTLRDYL